MGTSLALLAAAHNSVQQARRVVAAASQGYATLHLHWKQGHPREAAPPNDQSNEVYGGAMPEAEGVNGQPEAGAAVSRLWCELAEQQAAGIWAGVLALGEGVCRRVGVIRGRVLL